MDRDKIISDLNTLLTRNYDAEKGYHKAAEHVKDPDLKRMFEVYSDQRYHFGHDLKGEITSMGGEPDKGASVASGAHRTWMDIKSMLSSDDTESMLEECIRGEEAAVKNYKEVLEHTDLPATTRTVLNDHVTKIEEALYQVRELEEQH